MKVLRITLLAIGLAALAAACGGKNKTESTTMENKGGDMASGTDDGSGMGGDMYGGDMYGNGGGGMDPCGD